jgi:hypothetical protein
MDVPSDSLDKFSEARNYFNVMKLRSIFVPEMAFLGNESGNSGGNIAGKMQEIHEASEEIEMMEILDEVNKYMLPQILQLNFKEFVNNGGKAWVETKGFRSEDMDLNRQIIQLLGQADPELLAEVDTKELLGRAGLPLKDPAILAAERKALAEAGAAAPPLVAPAPGSVGVIANPNLNPGFTNGGSVPEPNTFAGFAERVYVNPPDAIELSDSDVDDFISSLPETDHYSDRTVRALMMQLRRVWLGHFRRIYPEFAKYVSKQTTVQFADDDIRLEYGPLGMIELAQNGNGDKRTKVTIISRTKAEKIAKKLIREYKNDSLQLRELKQRSADILRKMVRRGVNISEQKIDRAIDIDDDVIDSFINKQADRLVKLTHQTIENELREHLINQIMDGKSVEDVATDMVSRFETLPYSKADRVARSETRDVINAANLITSEGAGIRYVRAKDGTQHDEECAKRNNKLLTVKEAWSQLHREHPYGTLSFEPIPRLNFAVKWVDDPKAEFAWFDDENSIAFIRTDLNNELANKFLSDLADHLIKAG